MRALLGQPERPLRGAAAQLKNVLARKVGKQVQLCLRDAPGAPGGRDGRKLNAGAGLVTITPAIPVRSSAPLALASRFAFPLRAGLSQ